MALQATSRTVGDVAVVDLGGRITLGRESAILRATVRELVDQGYRKILLNLADIDYIDSSGIGELISAHTTISGLNGELKLLQLTRRVHDLLQITRLFTVFDVQSDEVAAIRSFRGT